MLAIPLTAPPQSSQVKMSIVNTRFYCCAHVIETWRAGGRSRGILHRPVWLRRWVKRASANNCYARARRAIKRLVHLDTRSDLPLSDRLVRSEDCAYSRCSTGPSVPLTGKIEAGVVGFSRVDFGLCAATHNEKQCI